MTTMTGFTRRTLLGGAAASAALPWFPRVARAEGPIPRYDWDQLARAIKRPVLQPNDPRFVRLTQPENSYYFSTKADEAPLAVVRPQTPSEVGIAIKWARDNNVPMVARSGGHSYAGCSTIHGLIINTGDLRSVRFDAANDLLDIGGGVLNGDIFAALKDVRYHGIPGGAAIVHGRCGAVGASAFLMGGGIGFDMRGYGIGSDLVDSVDIALADGSVVRNVSAKQGHNPDLFWAVCGGGGGNLGIATGWRLRPFAVAETVVFTATWDGTTETQPMFARLIRGLEQAPDNLGAQITVAAPKPGSKDAPSPSIHLTGQFRGTRKAFDAAMRHLLDGASSQAVVDGPYWGVQAFLDQTPVPNKYQETSLFAGFLSDRAIDTTYQQLRGWAGASATAHVTFFRTGGRVNKRPAIASAFVHRSSEWLANTSLDLSDCASDDAVKANIVWLRGFHDALHAALPSLGSYQNFPDPGLANHREEYWGINLKRLQAMKRKLDPDFVFTPPQHQQILLKTDPPA